MLASGEWAGAMCLTEPHCGTDLGLLRTTATPQRDGSYALTGTKIFISAGEHDLTTNIVYMVLARLPDAPKGSKGISLFVVPKMLPEGGRNLLSCTALERKMGIHGCPTCVMNFDGATGWLVGESHQGLKAMFAMMNAERLAVGIQGLAIAQASQHNSVAYARERLQGRAARGAVRPDLAADPIIVHPDVRRMLMAQKALTEGCRMLAVAVACSLDRSERHTDETVRHHEDALVALLTPVVKAFLTDTGSEVANLGVQLLGGHGYVRDNGQEQYVRDARITQIYEGTNGVQAMDFLGRKILADGGKTLDHFLNPIEIDLATSKIDPRLAEYAVPVEQALALVRDAVDTLRRRAASNPEEIGAAATDFLRLFALATIGYHWHQAARVALPKSNADFYCAKLATARFYMERILPQVKALHTGLMAGAASIMDFDDALI
jgi:butyryl-CoA dehydrogenase